MILQTRHQVEEDHLTQEVSYLKELLSGALIVARTVWWEGSHCDVTNPVDSQLLQLTSDKHFIEKPGSHYEQKSFFS